MHEEIWEEFGIEFDDVTDKLDLLAEGSLFL